MSVSCRLYVDECGDHKVTESYRNLGERYLALVGCQFALDSRYSTFREGLEELKGKYFGTRDPDEPIVLHRRELKNAEGVFGCLRDPSTRRRFDSDLLELVESTEFVLYAVVVDKLSHSEKTYRKLDHTYHYCLHALLERYCGRLRYFRRRGDVLAEARGRKEDTKLREEYRLIFEGGTSQMSKREAQERLTSRKLKAKPKTANIAGLQLADLLAHPARLDILRTKGRAESDPTGFAAELLAVARKKYNRRVGLDRVDGYGCVFLE